MPHKEVRIQKKSARASPAVSSHIHHRVSPGDLSSVQSQPKADDAHLVIRGMPVAESRANIAGVIRPGPSAKNSRSILIAASGPLWVIHQFAGIVRTVEVRAPLQCISNH